jgi:integrase
MTRLRLEYVHEYRDRHGKLRRYFRRKGANRIPLPGLPGSEEFMTAYQVALAGITAPREIGASRTKPGTVNAAIVGYYQSLAFRELALGTQRGRRNILEQFRQTHGDKHVATLPQKFIVQMLSRMKPVSARNWLKAFRGLLEFAMAEGFRADNPARGIKLPKHREKSHHPWTAEEVARFEAHYPIGTKARLAIALLLNTAQRPGDVTRMGPQHIRNGAIHIRQQKTGTPLEIEINADLQKVIDATPCRHLTFLTTNSGRQFTAPAFSRQVRIWCDAVGLKHCTAHGLRHTVGYQMANSGATTHEIAAMTGHKSLAEVQRYTRGADQAKLARQGMAKLMAKRGTAGG